MHSSSKSRSNSNLYNCGSSKGGHQIGEWKEIANFDKFEENCVDYTLYAVIPTQVTLPSFKINKGKISKQTFTSDMFQKFSVSGFRTQ